jgi:hypothetical protein
MRDGNYFTEHQSTISQNRVKLLNKINYGRGLSLGYVEAMGSPGWETTVIELSIASRVRTLVCSNDR